MKEQSPGKSGWTRSCVCRLIGISNPRTAYTAAVLKIHNNAQLIMLAFQVNSKENRIPQREVGDLMQTPIAFAARKKRFHVSGFQRCGWCVVERRCKVCNTMGCQWWWWAHLKWRPCSPCSTHHLFWIFLCRTTTRYSLVSFQLTRVGTGSRWTFAPPWGWTTSRPMTTRASLFPRRPGNSDVEVRCY